MFLTWACACSLALFPLCFDSFDCNCLSFLGSSLSLFCFKRAFCAYNNLQTFVDLRRKYNCASLVDLNWRLITTEFEKIKLNCIFRTCGSKVTPCMANKFLRKDKSSFHLIGLILLISVLVQDKHKGPDRQIRLAGMTRVKP